MHSRSLDDRDYLKRAMPEHTALRDVIRTKSKRAALTMIGEHLRTAYLRLSNLSE